MKVEVDTREQSRIKPALFYFSKNNTVDLVELSIGDYIFSNGDKTCGFEFKTCSDFITSVNDGRVFNQALDQAERFDYHFVVVQYTDELLSRLCKEHYYKTRMSFSKSQFYGAIARLNTYTTVLTSSTLNNCFELMEKQALKCFDDKTITKSFNKNKGSSAFRLLNNTVKGVGESTSKHICSSLNLECIEDVFKLNKEDLLSVDGVGERKAESILKQLKKEYS